MGHQRGWGECCCIAISRDIIRERFHRVASKKHGDTDERRAAQPLRTARVRVRIRESNSENSGECRLNHGYSYKMLSTRGVRDLREGAFPTRGEFPREKRGNEKAQATKKRNE